jgi:hypothetical protein
VVKGPRFLVKAWLRALIVESVIRIGMLLKVHFGKRSLLGYGLKYYNGIYLIVFQTYLCLHFTLIARPRTKLMFQNG